jgi:hypothetical protein
MQTNARRGHTTQFIVDGIDHFVALTDLPGVRVGMVGGPCFDIPQGHAYYDRVCECATEQDAENYFDELVSFNG